MLLMQTISPKNSGNFGAPLGNNKSMSSTLHPKETDVFHSMNYARLSNNVADLNPVRSPNINNGSPFKTY
jgi:hypothetical protein